MVTGVSGSGKSTLVNEILYKGLNKIVNKSKNPTGAYKEITGYDGYLAVKEMKSEKPKIKL